MKKLLSILLSLTLCLSLVVPVFGADNAPKDPDVGTVVSGFLLKEKSELNLISSQAWIFEHVKTGATLIYYKNKDQNRAFNIAFRTPAVDNTGVNHILEHSLITSSDQYQGSDVFFSQAYKTYNTFVNAYTYAGMTSYPSASLDEAQLLKMTDITMDMMFHATVKKDERIFKREGWHYSLADAKAPLKRVGVVYNEMKGYRNLQSEAIGNLNKTLYPGSLVGNNAGGDPASIPTLTYQHFLDTMNTYYHPSNAMVFLYGDLDYTKFLDVINRYFLEFDQKDIKIDTGKVKPLTAQVTASYEFPAPASAQPETIVNYAYVVNDNSIETEMDLSILESILNHPSGPLMEAFYSSGLGSELTVMLDNESTQPNLSFMVSGAKPGKTKEIKALIDGALAKAAKGIDRDVLDAVLADVTFANAAIGEQENLGVNVSLNTAFFWTYAGNQNYYKEVEAYMAKFPELAKAKHFEGFIQKYLIENPHCALVSTTAKPGLLEKQEARELKKLEAIKAAMSPAEIQKMVKDTADFEQWVKSADTISDEKIQGVSVAAISTEVKDYKVSDVRVDGMRLISTPADSVYTGLTALTFDSTGVPIDKLHYLNLFASLLGNVSTQKHTAPQLSVEISKKLNGFGAQAVSLRTKEGSAPVLACTWMGMMKDYEKNVDLVSEILTQSDMTDLDSIKPYVKQLLSGYEQSLQSDPFQLAESRATADWGEQYAYDDYINGLPFLNFLRSVDKKLEKNPKLVTDQLVAVKDMVIGNANVTAQFTSSAENIQVFENHITKLMTRLPKNKIVSQDYSKIKVPVGNEALAMNSDVCYNVLDVPASSLEKYNPGEYTALASLITNEYMVERLRYAGGAYGTELFIGTDGMGVYSYRDPNLKETYDVYDKVDDFAASLQPTQAQLDSYIINALGNITRPVGVLTEGMGNIDAYLLGRGPEFKENYLKNVRDTTPARVAQYVEMLKVLTQKGDRLTVANASRIQENKNLFDRVIDVSDQSMADKIQATPIRVTVSVDGKTTDWQAMDMEGTTYFRVKDIAKAVSGTEKQFDVSWDAAKKAVTLTAGQPCTVLESAPAKDSGAIQMASPSTDFFYKDGKMDEFEACTIYNVGDHNYFKLQDLCKIFHIGLTYDKATNTMVMDTKTNEAE